jgi:hypothetical protein
MSVSEDLKTLTDAIALDTGLIADGIGGLNAKIAELEAAQGVDLSELKADVAALHNVAVGLQTVANPAPVVAEPVVEPVAEAPVVVPDAPVAEAPVEVPGAEPAPAPDVAPVVSDTPIADEAAAAVAVDPAV